MSVEWTDMKNLPSEQKELLLDISQAILDVIGIFEPTPFADTTSALISIWRGEWVNAGLSGLSIIPYLGDAAKLGKLPKYLETVNKAIAVAVKDAKFEKLLRPVLEKFYMVLDRIPQSIVPTPVRTTLDALRKRLMYFLPNAAKLESRLEQLTDEMLRLTFGSTRNVGTLPRENMRTIVKYFDRYKVKNGNLEEWKELVKGIDLHASKPIQITRFQRGEVVAQYVQTETGKTGQWWVRLQGKPSTQQLGVSDAGRVTKVFVVRREVEVLQSKAAGAADWWTRSGNKPHTAIVLENGKYVMKSALQVPGKGEQYFFHADWKTVEHFMDQVR